jgi:hypothetical protein
MDTNQLIQIVLPTLVVILGKIADGAYERIGSDAISKLYELINLNLEKE